MKLQKKHRYFCANLLLVSVSVLPALIRADITIDESTSYYDITGSSTSEFRESIYANSKVDRSTHGFDASTNWSISWQFDVLPEATECRINNTNITAKIKYRLPRWQAFETSTDTALTKEWGRYIDHLTRHESIHGEITKVAVNFIELTLLDLHNGSPGISCQDLRTKAYIRVAELITALRHRHEKFDLDTDHGTKNTRLLP